MSIVDFGDTRVREVMTPRTDIVWIDVAASLTVLFDLFVESKYSRIPVVRGSIDTVVGIVHVKDIFQAIRSGVKRSIADADAGGVLRAGDEEGLRAAARVPAAPPLDGHRGGRVRRRLGPRDRRGPPRGDRRRDLRRARGRARARHARRASSAYSVSGKANIAVDPDLFGRGPEEEEFTTVGGFLSSRLGHIPKPGETYREYELRFTVEEADRRRVYRVRVEPELSSQLSALSSQPETSRAVVS